MPINIPEIPLIVYYVLGPFERLPPPPEQKIRSIRSKPNVPRMTPWTKYVLRERDWKRARDGDKTENPPITVAENAGTAGANDVPVVDFNSRP